jgi:hypothetical protein
MAVVLINHYTTVAGLSGPAHVFVRAHPAAGNRYNFVLSVCFTRR